MQVIKRGIPPESLNYRASCNGCHSVLEFKKGEARAVNDRNETVYVVKCPVCTKEIWIASQALIPVD
nr:hypothetical protein [uncultured Acinetobacter sp.]